MFKNYKYKIYNHFSKIFQKTKIILSNNELKNNVDELDECAMELSEIYKKIKEYKSLVKNLSEECKNRSIETLEELQFQNIPQTNDKFKFILRGSGRNLKWADDNEIEKKHKLLNKKITLDIKNNDDKIQYRNISTINDINIGNLKVPIATKLQQITPAIQWYIGDDNNKAGLYMCLSNECYIEVPFPNVIDGTKNNLRTGTIKCKYGKINDCMTNREILAHKFNSDVKICNFAHIGDKYNKLGTIFRCPKNPGFGEHYNLKNDMEDINETNVKILLMYSISDLLLSEIWCQKNKKNKCVLHNLDICI